MKLVVVLALVLSFLISPLKVNAITSCQNRFLTLVNPVRSRSVWLDQSLDPINNQYNLIKQYSFPATWLIQYDTLKDPELLKVISTFDSNQELGLFVEVSQQLATDSRVIYPYDAPWFSPKAVFLSSYSQSERIKLIQQQFKEFKNHFGDYPKSVGAWWIDSYSLDFMKKNYGVEAVMIVSDQRSTDNYGVWGGWWGYPYYPTRTNILAPAVGEQDKQDLVVIQWAQRDPTLAYGSGKQSSNYSFQANDYIFLGLDTTHFKKLSSIYLDCQNPLGQITVGLETGLESVNFLNEYHNQLDYLSQRQDLQVVTMSSFSQRFKTVYPTNPQEIHITGSESEWILTPLQRSNKVLGDDIKYNQNVSFKDYFIADKEDFLNRDLNQLQSQNQSSFIPWYLLSLILLFGLSYFRKIINVWQISIFFLLSCFGFLIRSHPESGWLVFYGPVISNLNLVHFLLPFVSFGIVYFFYYSLKKSKLNQKLLLPLIALSFGIEPILMILRASYISGKYYFGIAPDSLRFVGLSLRLNPFNLEFMNLDLPGYQAAGLLRFSLEKLWSDWWIWLVIYPLAHLLVAIILAKLLSLISPQKSKFLLLILSFLLLIYLWQILKSDPIVALPIN